MTSKEDADRLFFMAHDLGGAGHWADTVGMQMGRVLQGSWDLERDSTPRNNHRLHCESYFFLASVRQLLRVCRLCADITQDEQLVKALTTFDKAAPAAVNFRDWFEHLDAYFTGAGRMQKSGDVGPGAVLSIQYGGDQVILHFDDRTLDLAATKDAAQELADVAGEVWMEHAVRRRPPGFRTMRRP